MALEREERTTPSGTRYLVKVAAKAPGAQGKARQAPAAPEPSSEPVKASSGAKSK